MKRMILAALTVLMAQASALAYDFIENGFAFNILKDGTVSLTNKVKDFSYDKEMDQTLAYKGAVTVPASVKHAGKVYKVSAIASNAFYDCRSVTSVTISEGIRTVEKDAFYYCGMTSLSIPASVTRLVPGCLHQCTRLATITVSPKNMNYTSQGNCIYNKAMTQLFFVSPVLKLYRFPASVKSVADYAFNGSTVKRLTIPPTLTHIGGYAFYSNDIKEIEEKRPLQKLAGSKDYMPGCPVPVWALSTTAAKTVNTAVMVKALNGKNDTYIPNTYCSTGGGAAEQTVVISDLKGTVSFNGDSYPNYRANAKTIIEVRVKELHDYPTPEPGYGSLASQQELSLFGVVGYVDK